MPVPDTDTFTLQDVVDEINPTTDDLTDCFADANAIGFDATYSGSKDRLLNFRNYDHNTLTQFHISSSGFATPALACGEPFPVKYYHNGSGALPANGDIVYTTPAGDTPLNGGDNHYAISSNTIQVSSVGLVSNLTGCTPP